MNRSLFAVPAMVCLAAALVTAQAPAERPNPPAAEQPAAQQPTTPRPTTPPMPAQQPASPSESSMASSKLTYTGCVKPGTGADTWVLENAEVAQKAGASSTGTVGTSGTPKMTLNLDPAATVNLKAHANHKVEVVGAVSPAKAGADAVAGAASAQAPRLQFSVESVKMVSATCP